VSIHITTLYTAMCNECDYCGPDRYREDMAMTDEQAHKVAHQPTVQDHTNGSQA
jgi:hypothetical protein